MKKYQVYISYCSKKLEVARECSRELSNHNITNWFDKDHLYKETSKEYKECIQSAILESEVMLFIYSNEVNDSPFIISHEVKFAIENEIPIFCFKLDDSTMSDELLEFIKSKLWMYTFNDINTKKQIADLVTDEKRLGYIKGFIDINAAHKNTSHRSINIFLLRIVLQRYFGMISPFGTYKQLDQSGGIYRGEELVMRVVPKAMFWPIPPNKRAELEELGFLKSNKDHSNIDILSKDFENTELIKKMRFFIESEYSDIENIDKFLDDVANKTADAFIADLKAIGPRFNGPMLGIYDMWRNRANGDERHSLEIDLYVSDYFTFKFTVELYHQLRTISNRFEIVRIEQINRYAPFLCSLGMGGFIFARQESDKYLLFSRRSASISMGDIWHFSYDEAISLERDAIINSDGKFQLKNNGILIDPYKNVTRGIYEEYELDLRNSKRNSCIVEIGIILSDRIEIELMSYFEMDLHQTMHMFNFIRNNRPDVKFVNLDKLKEEFQGKLITPESYALAEKISLLGHKSKPSEQLANVCKPNNVFISCKHEDYDKAEEIFNYLKQNGHNPFIATQSIRQKGSSDYGETIDEALDDCDHLILFATKLSHVKSRYVKYEWSTYNEEYKSGRKEGNIITILADDIDPTKLPIGIRNKQSIKLSDYKTEILSYLNIIS